MEGYGNTIKTFLPDGKQSAAFEIHGNLKGEHTVQLTLNKGNYQLMLLQEGHDDNTDYDINQAMIDWLARSRNTSAASLLQIPGETPPPVSVTIGLNSPEGAAERVRLWLKTAAFRFWKLKVASPHGIEADQALCEAVLREVPPGSKLSVDANGGWDLKLAQRMGAWLSERGFDHMEQPLPRGQESDLPLLRAHCRLPIIADESCLNATEIPALVSRVDGINVVFMIRAFGGW